MLMSRGQLIYLLYLSSWVGKYKNHICCYADRCCPILPDSGGLSLSLWVISPYLDIPLSKHLFSSRDDDRKNYCNVITEPLG